MTRCEASGISLMISLGRLWPWLIKYNILIFHFPYSTSPATSRPQSNVNGIFLWFMPKFTAYYDLMDKEGNNLIIADLKMEPGE